MVSWVTDMKSYLTMCYNEVRIFICKLIRKNWIIYFTNTYMCSIYKVPLSCAKMNINLHSQHTIIKYATYIYRCLTLFTELASFSDWKDAYSMEWVKTWNSYFFQNIRVVKKSLKGEFNHHLILSNGVIQFDSSKLSYCHRKS